MMVDENEARRRARKAYECGVNEARAAFASELRFVIDDFTGQVFGLRQEVRRAIGLPPLAGSPGDCGPLQ